MWRIPLETTKKLKGWEKPSLQYKLMIYKHCLACTLEWTWKWKSQHYVVVLHEQYLLNLINFTAAFPLIRKTWDDGFAGKVGGWGILRNGGDPSNGGVDALLWTMHIIQRSNITSDFVILKSFK